VSWPHKILFPRFLPVAFYIEDKEPPFINLGLIPGRGQLLTLFFASVLVQNWWLRGSIAMDILRILVEAFPWTNFLPADIITTYQRFIKMRTDVRFSSQPKIGFFKKFIQKDYCAIIFMFKSLRSPWPQPEREFILIMNFVIQALKSDIKERSILQKELKNN
jgi:hypothetical protein